MKRKTLAQIIEEKKTAKKRAAMEELTQVELRLTNVRKFSSAKVYSKVGK